MTDQHSQPSASSWRSVLEGIRERSHRRRHRLICGPAIRISGFEIRRDPSDVSEIGRMADPRPQRADSDRGRHSRPSGTRRITSSPKGKTLTSYRNTNEHGLVLVEVDEQSDGKASDNMHSIADRTCWASGAADPTSMSICTGSMTIAWQIHSENHGPLDIPAAFGRNSTRSTAGSSPLVRHRFGAGPLRRDFVRPTRWPRSGPRRLGRCGSARRRTQLAQSVP